MLVIFGANGRTGREILREALARGIAVRPVVRDDRDARGLDKIVDVQQICYADADHPTALPPVLEGASMVVSAINARTAGPGSPRYQDEAGANIVKAAMEAGIEKVLHMSVVGAFRWSPYALNRRSFRLDRAVRIMKDLPWSMFRVSCYFDEVIEGHVRPPDGARPHPIPRSSRYTPISRLDMGRIVVNHLGELKPSRTLYVGGPEIFSSEQLEALIHPYRQGAPARPWQSRTRFEALPPGDVAVMPEHTRISVSMLPRDHLLHALDPSVAPPPAREPAPVYSREEPGPHPADQGRDSKLLREMGEDLRRVVHAQLVEDLGRMGIPTDGIKLDFASARERRNRPTAEAHGGRMVEMTGVCAVSEDGSSLHRGAVVFLRDGLAEEFACFWERDEGIPSHVWERLDMGVRRRLAEQARWQEDARVKGFAGGTELA